MDIIGVILVLSGFCITFLLGFAGCLAVQFFIDQRARQLNLEKASVRGVEAKQEQAERLMQFLTEVKAAFDAIPEDERDPKQFMIKQLPAIALKYPDVVLKFGARLQKLLAKQGLDLDGLGAAQ